MAESLLHVSDRLEKSLWHLHWAYIAGAVLDVFRENKQLEGRGGLKASADAWVQYHELRLQVWQRARAIYCRRTGRGTYQFPYSMDETAELYFRFRKRNEEEVASFAEEIRAAGGFEEPRR